MRRTLEDRRWEANNFGKQRVQGRGDCFEVARKA
jgi:hypothetical protein